MTDKKQTEKKHQSKETFLERTSILEWIVAFIGFVCVLFSVGYIIFHAATSGDKPPDFAVKVKSIKKQTNGYVVEFTIKNSGDNNAASVDVEGKLEKNGEEIETRSVSFPYVAAASEQSGGLVFTENPEAYELKLNAAGYENP